MRLLILGMIAGMTAFALSAPVVGQPSDDQIAPKSFELQRQGEGLLSAGKYIEAGDALETALAVDPRNRSAFVDLARVAVKQQLYGKAIRLANKALSLDPTDRDALAVQGQAMVELGAVPRAKDNLAKLQKLCGGGCPQLAALSSAINRGPTVAAASKPPQPPKSN